jgi:hypothetical protein
MGRQRGQGQAKQTKARQSGHRFPLVAIVAVPANLTQDDLDIAIFSSIPEHYFYHQMENHNARQELPTRHCQTL